ncbi:MAG: PGPGW domain-containing protein [Parcubacteria group bacterium]|nr:PGPGW domain-containing protein [Parcubacteria group bacterium]
MQKNLKRSAMTILGGAFIVVGLGGLVLPFVQGLLFIFLGVYLLSLEYHWLKSKLEHFEAKYPTLERYAKRFRAFFDKI